MSQVPVLPSASALAADASPSTRHRWLPAGSEGLRYRAGVVARALSAIVGGYLLSGLAAAVLALVLPASRLEASVTATMAALVVYPCAVMWVFAARGLGRALLGLVLPCAAMGALLLAWFKLGGGA